MKKWVNGDVSQRPIRVNGDVPIDPLFHVEICDERYIVVLSLSAYNNYIKEYRIRREMFCLPVYLQQR